MTGFDILELTANGAGLQAYFSKQFVDDSSFPALDGGDRVIVQPTPGGGLLIQLVTAVERYPITIDSPPDDLVTSCVDGPPERTPASALDAATIDVLAQYARPAAPDTSDSDSVATTAPTSSANHDHDTKHQTQR